MISAAYLFNLRRYYKIINVKTNETITVLLKQDFRNNFYSEIINKLKTKEYKIIVY